MVTIGKADEGVFAERVTQVLHAMAATETP